MANGIMPSFQEMYQIVHVNFLQTLRNFDPDTINYGQLVKEREGGRVVGKTRKIIFGDFESGNIETVYVERYNLTLRHGISRLVRKSLCFSKCKNMLDDHLDLYQCYTNLIRPHSTLVIETPERNQKHREDSMYG